MSLFFSGIVVIARLRSSANKTKGLKVYEEINIVRIKIVHFTESTLTPLFFPFDNVSGYLLLMILFGIITSLIS